MSKKKIDVDATHQSFVFMLISWEQEHKQNKSRENTVQYIMEDEK